MPKDSIAVSKVLEWEGGKMSRRSDALVTEEPLQIAIAAEPLSVTLRTPGDEAELVAGFLFAEGIIRSAAEIAGIQCGDAGPCAVARVALAPTVVFEAGRNRRNFAANSSCGFCGKTSFDAGDLNRIARPNPDLRIDPQVICRLPETLKSAQAVFARTGGLHAAALFDGSGALLALKEDVGRHNAVDKLVGWALFRERVPLGDCILVVSGRAGFEIVQKSLMAGVPAVASISAASSLAADLARRFGQTLVGFLRERRFVVYCGESRLGLERTAAAAIDRRSRDWHVL